MAKSDYRDLRRYAYATQKEHSRTRGIDFRFTFEQWVAWWEGNLGPDWMSLRGCRKGQYVMARIGDVGAYEPGNVLCLTVEKNHAEGVVQRGGAGWNAGVTGIRKKGNKLPDEEVIAIYEEPGTHRGIAEVFGVSQSLVSRIKAKKLWGPLTDEHDGRRRFAS